jgi:CRP/FNR family transcriptional regulator
MENPSKLKALSQAPIFSGLNQQELDSLAAIAFEKSFKSGDFVFREEDSPHSFYVIADGRIKVSKSSPSGREFIVTFFGPGDVFGEVAVFANKPYPASAQAVADTSVIGIRRAELLRFLADNPEVALKIINMLGGRLREAVSRLRDLAGERVEQRIAGILLMLNDKLGPELPFTRQDIADMSGTTVETAIRTMSRLTEDGVIRSARGKITVINRERLSLLSQTAA